MSFGFCYDSLWLGLGLELGLGFMCHDCVMVVLCVQDSVMSLLCRYLQVKCYFSNFCKIPRAATDFLVGLSGSEVLQTTPNTRDLQELVFNAKKSLANYTHMTIIFFFFSNNSTG